MCGKCKVISFTEDEPINDFQESENDRRDFESELDQLLEAQIILATKVAVNFYQSNADSLELDQARNNFLELKDHFLNNWKVQEKGR